jgi:hypothetical protein
MLIDGNRLKNNFNFVIKETAAPRKSNVPCHYTEAPRRRPGAARRQRLLNPHLI